MKSGRGGRRENAGRKATGRKPEITFRPTEENLQWLKDNPGSYSDIINRLIDEAKKQ